MSRRGRRRSQRIGAHLLESLALYRKMGEAATEAEFQALLAEHDRCTDADGLPRPVWPTLEEFRRGPLSGTISPWRS